MTTSHGLTRTVNSIFHYMDYLLIDFHIMDLIRLCDTRLAATMGQPQRNQSSGPTEQERENSDGELH
jgi:hypothetical protein